jgi:hypothetical protein
LIADLLPALMTALLFHFVRLRRAQTSFGHALHPE